MRLLLRNILSRNTAPKRNLAHVHDVKIQWGSMAQQEEDINKKGDGGMELNVLNTPLTRHSTTPPTGFTRSGYCSVPPSDTGNHAIAGILTKEFLDFSAARGNDLRQVGGLTEGCKWCLCVSRWKEAFDARTGAEDRKVPRVVLSATNRSALRGVGLGELRGFAVDGEGEGQGGK
ncbi:hypothetical protein BDW02DRAFT_559305 [Decorospora gaudefroyi]|uniref:Uncharacterized protein n=1 Tax=Decorospora gaudefroyi TaxID=184978 RepID=A0A6A5K769_9PLEO|nr:hypothetical protein BDW02DRAFT_559305 [Decorospora gaudefroyi]